MKFQHLQGLIAAPFTPMNTDGSLNLSLVPSYYHFLKANNVKGAFICGSTGEGVSLTTAEKQLVAKAWAEATMADEDFKVMMLVGGTSIKECTELALFAEQAGLYAVSFTAPFYFRPPSVQYLADCCEAIASKVPSMPFYYYHIPVLNRVDFAMIDLLNEVDGRIENFAGVKYTHEDFMDFLSCLNFAGNKYDMLWGRDENMLPALSVGATGAVGSTFNYAAPLYHELLQTYAEGEIEKAQRLQQTSIDMIRLLGKYGGIATGKAFMKLVGLDCGEFRLPVKNMNATEFSRFRSDAESLEFSRFCSKPAEAIVH